MAVALQSPGDHHAIGAALESVQNLDGIDSACTRDFDDASAWRILDP
jgi:hypothetical protein